MLAKLWCFSCIAFRFCLLFAFVFAAFFVGWLLQLKTMANELGLYQAQNNKVEGKVITTRDNAEEFFIAFSLGRDDGIEAGDLGVVMQGKELVAVIKVTRSEYNISAAKVVQFYTKDPAVCKDGWVRFKSL